MKALAVDLGGSHAICAVVENDQVLAARSLTVAVANRLADVLPLLAVALRESANECGAGVADCAGLAFGFPGLVDACVGRVLSTNEKYADAVDLDLPAWCAKDFGIPFKIENDARLALLGERFAGAARGFDDAVMITLGTGIGGAAMIGGRLLRGKHFQAGCLGGHLPAKFDGRICTCGNRGCVEAEASTWALPAICHEWKNFRESRLARAETLDFAALFDAARAGDAVAAEIYERCLRVWAVGAVGMIHAYDPEIVVFGGGVMRSADLILPFVADYVRQHAWTAWGKVEVRAAELGSNSALLGAIPLLLEEM